MNIIKIQDLENHPQNPRIVLREDVLSSIQAGMEDGFDEAHALIVRPAGDKYQIISGHHRAEAAKRVGLTDIPCWVRDLSDEDAYMLLATSNSQGELSPLEIGIHALHCVPVEKGGRGKKGGLSAYAEKVGKSQQFISQLLNAARVADKVTSQLVGLLDKTKHLNVIHALPESCWDMAVEIMLDREWSAADTKHWISLSREFDVPSQWVSVFPLRRVILKFLKTKEFSAQTLSKIIRQCDSVFDLIDSYDVNRDSFKEDFVTFASDEDNWDYRKILKRFNELKNKLDEFTSKSVFHHGDFGDHISELDDKSVSVLFTDPPYGMDYKSDYKLDRREDRKHKKIENDGDVESAMDVFSSMLSSINDKLKDDAHLFVFATWKTEQSFVDELKQHGFTIRGSIVWVKNNTGMGDPNTTFAPKHERIIHAVKGSPIIYSRLSDVIECDRVDTKNHPTEKPVEVMEKYIEAVTVEGDLVADPFAGVASTLVACKKINREFWGCEIDATYYGIGNGRIYG